MSIYWWLAVGAVIAGPVWVAGTLWLTRRIWRNARRMSIRTRGQDHLAELGQLAGGLAHEIKNPLSTINVNLQLVAEDLARLPGDEPQRWLRRLESVRRESDRLKGILDDFLGYAGKVVLTRRTVDLRRLVGELADFFAPQAEAARIVMRTTLPEQPVACSVDPDFLKQALLNLMINAVDAMADGGELIIRLSADDDQARIEVIDTGTGMSADDLTKIFGVYYSTKKGGTGLGLPTTRRIVREHGGTLNVESDVGKGTRFTIALPLGEQCE